MIRPQRRRSLGLLLGFTLVGFTLAASAARAESPVVPAPPAFGEPAPAPEPPAPAPAPAPAPPPPPPPPRHPRVVPGDPPPRRVLRKSPPPPPATTDYVHDGFYLRVGAGPIYARGSVRTDRVSQPDVTLRGLGGAFEVWIGGTPGRGLSVGGLAGASHIDTKRPRWAATVTRQARSRPCWSESSSTPIRIHCGVFTSEAWWPGLRPT